MSFQIFREGEVIGLIKNLQKQNKTLTYVLVRKNMDSWGVSTCLFHETYWLLKISNHALWHSFLPPSLSVFWITLSRKLMGSFNHWSLSKLVHLLNYELLEGKHYVLWIQGSRKCLADGENSVFSQWINASMKNFLEWSIPWFKSCLSSERLTVWQGKGQGRKRLSHEHSRDQ